jgi:glycosyltransferase involved in cell wall biosynthesis
MNAATGLGTARPCVSVLMIAYNVEEYIRQALDSILMQEVGFRYEVVIGEDCSTDRTREILGEYGARYPDRIRLLLRQKNLGMNPNFFATYAECRGRYIALIDGDDYWTSPHKLQKQVDFLDAHPECTICFHNTLVVYDDGDQETHPFHLSEPVHRISAGMPKPFSGLDEIAPGNFMQTCSVMYRGGVVRQLPEWVHRMPTFDWPLHVLHAEQGRIAYLDEVLGTYRVHSRGFWSAGMSHYRSLADVETMIEGYATLSHYLRGRFDAPIRQRLAMLYRRAADLAMSSGRHAEARRYMLRFLRVSFPEFGSLQKQACKRIVKSLVGEWKQRLAA